MKFTKKQILDEIKALRRKRNPMKLYESKVYVKWCQLADNWLQFSEEYYLDGFTGFNERTPKEILEDFRLNDLVKN